MTNLDGLLRRLAWPLAVFMAAWHLWVVATVPPEALIYRGIHLLFALLLAFLLYPTGAGRFRAVDLVLLALTAWVIGYPIFNYDYIVNRIPYIDDPTLLDQASAIATVLLVLEATRRLIGWALPLTAIAFLAHALLATEVTLPTLLDQLYLTTEGVFGSTLGVSAAYVIVFVIFGAFMERSGTGQLFMDFALSLAGHTAGGPGKVSVISSSLFGTISGSAVANVMVDGPITIPLMKRSGFRPAFAAGVEAVASTGGQIMPPIMGAAAFVMAEFLAVSYFQVTLWALIPAILYYLAVFLAVHFEARRQGLVGLPRADLPRLGSVMRERGHLFVPILVVMGGMLLGYSAPLCALAGTVTCLPMALARRSTRGGIGWRTVVDALEDGARNTLPVALACACAGIVIGCIALTGLGLTFTGIVVGLAQNSLMLALVLTMIAGIILGMGMPTTPAYIIMVAMLVPAIVKLGVAIPAAHMFAFYFAILSAITPPVALAVYAAAGLAKADLWESGIAAIKIGIAGFVVPFMFIYQPELLLIGDWFGVSVGFATAVGGIVCLAAALHGFLLAPTRPWERVSLLAAAALLVGPSLLAGLVGFGLLAVVMLSQRAGLFAKSPA